MTERESLRQLVAGLAISSSYGDEPHLAVVLAAGPAVVELFLEQYPISRSWKQRASLMYHALRFARRSEAALELGVRGLADRSKEVRYRACLLLAYAQDPRALEPLRNNASHPNLATRADILAAIDAIESRNHHYFVDRDHSGMVFYRVNDDDA